MEKRVNIQVAEPQAFKAMYALEGYLQTSGITTTHLNLIKTRASQINGCAFCIDMHTKEALKNGETTQRLFLLNAWRETSLFTEEEKAILALTEEVTLIHQHGVSEAVYQQASVLFDEHRIAQFIMAIATINAWNRISISTHKEIEK
jgi:AhpD family alkylhydroperoxidase